ncbi:hypothetical protein QR680_008470 [Steinernema hermaphroditum]|uniref:Uncharacterized protein n=1 Tax=Steinernema hermaphroditum TaxID=289476 RepID=A0AA39II75_9BILA|nr:hypothetical protein QR680_008470 [Steinernema hermaphroditum]
MFFSTSLLLLLPLLSSALRPVSQEFSRWESFVQRHHKVYATPQEEARRFAIFVENLRRAEERTSLEKGSAVFGVDPFADLSRDEFRRTRLMDKTLLAQKKALASKEAPEQAYELGDIPTSFDWRKHHAITAVKNQGGCGSCWAFSTAANIESVFAVKKGKLFSLSEQQIVDCATDQEGCGGGWPIQAMADVKHMGGLEPERDYGYRGVDERCRFNKTEVVVQINDAVSLSKDEQKIAAYLVKHGGVSVAFNAEDSIMGYTSGIVKLSPEACNPETPDHAVLLVGYGTEKGVPFWIVKNSWGADWGENGYFRIFRGANTCGIADNAVSAVVD